MYEGRIQIPRLRVEGLDARRCRSCCATNCSHSSGYRTVESITPPTGSKDIADALACAAMTAVQLGGREEGGGERRFYEPDTFPTGGYAELPFATTSLKGIWVSGDMSLPGTY